jgi:hypothetical protein
VPSHDEWVHKSKWTEANPKRIVCSEICNGRTRLCGSALLDFRQVQNPSCVSVHESTEWTCGERIPSPKTEMIASCKSGIRAEFFLYGLAVFIRLIWPMINATEPNGHIVCTCLIVYNRRKKLFGKCGVVEEERNTYETLIGKRSIARLRSFSFSQKKMGKLDWNFKCVYFLLLDPNR